jgi:predicted Zn finger-like uncharacterized protein
LTHISEMTTSSTIYTARRLRFLGMAGRETNLMQWSEKIQPARKQLSDALKPPPKPAPVPSAAKPAGAPSKLSLGGIQTAPPAPSIRVVCDKCQNAMRIPLAVLRGKTSLNVRCPQCQNVMTLRSKPITPSPATAGPQT